MLEQLAALVPRRLLQESGEVFYAGREAFRRRGGLYVLGFNPGGNPDAEARLIGTRIREVVATTTPWSAYVDEAWRGRKPGDKPLQRRVTYMLEKLGANPRLTPASNLIFVRSVSAHELADAQSLENACWPFHQAVIKGLAPRAILCLGTETGRRVRARLDAHLKIGEFTEKNGRGWTSLAHRNASGLIILSLTHPGRAHWTNAASDPSAMARKALGVR
jgi:hypothetical protein